MTPQDIVIGALCCWRENRGGGSDGMRSVMNVLLNRAAKDGTDVFTEATKHDQFSSMTYPGDPNLVLYPKRQNAADWAAWVVALGLAQTAADGNLADITGGATSYYAASIDAPPYWAASMTPTVTVAGQLFFK